MRWRWDTCSISRRGLWDSSARRWSYSQSRYSSASLLNLLYRRRNFAQAGNWALTIMMVFVLFAVHQGLVMFSPILSSKKLADAIEQEYRPGDVLVVNGTYEDASTLNFYLRQPIHIVNSRDEGNMYYGALFPDAPSIFEDDASLLALWNGPQARLPVGGRRQPARVREAERQLPVGAQRGQADSGEPSIAAETVK